MGGSVPDGLLFNIRANVDALIKDLKKVETGFDNVGKGGSSSMKTLGTQYRTLVDTTKLLGNSADITKKKMELLANAISSSLAGGAKMADKNIQTLVSQYKKLETAKPPEKGMMGLVGSILTANIAFAALQKAATLALDAIKEGLNYNIMMEQNIVAFGVMLGSLEKTITLTNELKNLVNTTPIRMEDAMQGSKALLAYGFSADNLAGNLKMLTTVASAVNVPLQDIVYVYGTLRSQGRAYTRDIMQFAMRGIPIYEELAKVLRTDTSSVKQLVEEGKVGFREVEQAFNNMTGAGGRFDGMLEKSMNTFGGQLNLATKNLQQLSGLFSEGLATGAREALKPLNTFMSFLVKMGDEKKRIESIEDAFIKLGMAKEAAMVFTGASKEAVADMVREAEILVYQSSKNKDISEDQLNIYKEQLSVLKAQAGIKAPPVMGNINPYVEKKTGKGGFGAQAVAQQLQADVGSAIRASQGDMESAAKGLQQKLGTTWKETINIMAYYQSMSLDQYSALLTKEAALSQEYGAVFERMMEKSFGVSGMKKATDAFAQLTGSFEEDFLLMQKMTKDGVYGAITSDKAKSAYDESLSSMISKYESTIKEMEQTPIFGASKAGTQEYEFLQLFIRRYKELEEIKAGRKEPKAAKEEKLVTDEFWKQYTAIRATLDLQKEGAAIRERIGTSGATVTEAKLFQLAQEKLSAEREMLANVVAISDQEGALTSAKEIQLRQDAIDLTYQEKKLNILAEQYNTMLNGDDKHWRNLQAQAVEKFNKGDAAGSAAATMQASTQGTQVGSLMAGADPITMVAKAFMDLLASLDNFGKLLNPISVIMEGLRPIMVQIDKFLKPVVVLLEMIGEAIGDLIGPILGVIFDLFGDIASVLAPIIQVLRPLLQALGTLAAFIWELCNPIVMVMDLLADMIGLSSDEIATKEEQLKQMQDLFDKELKSLQDLYNVGAISGKEYEARLAAMQKPGEAPMEESAMVQAINQVTDAIKNFLYPVILAIASYVAGIIGGIKGIIVGITGFVGGFATMVKGIFAGDGDLVIKGLKMMLLGIAGIIAGIIDIIIISPINAIIKGLKALNIAGWKPFKGFDTIKTLSSRVEDAMNSLAVGTGSVPKDMMAQIHQNEMVVPATFADSIRSGDLALTGGKGYNNGAPINIYISGNVVTERDLVKSISSEVKKLGRQGYL